MAARSLLAAGVIAAVAVACGHSPLPPRIGGLPRTRVWTGEQAARMADELFETGRTPRDAMIAEYGRPGLLRVWLARFSDGVSAHYAARAALLRVRSLQRDFTRPQDLREDPGRWFFVGRGGHHAVWVSERTVYWVMGDPRIIDTCLATLPAPTGGALT